MSEKKELELKLDEYPIVTIMIATFNSSNLLPMVLDAIRKQTYPQDRIEILLMDGGSTDSTYEIAKQYGCRIEHNPKTEPVAAKVLGFTLVSGKYMVSIDHDEVMTNERQLELQVKSLMETNLKVAFSSGYMRPKDYSRLNQYISEFGDPFSLFIYNFSKDYQYFLKTQKKYFKTTDKGEYVVVDYSASNRPVIFEFTCASTMIDMEYFRSIIGNEPDATSMVQEFHRMRDDGIHCCTLIKDTPVLHYSADSLKKYYPKLKWRVCNNVHFSEMASAGFTGRQQINSMTKIKKYLFVPYTFFIIPAFLHGVYLAATRKNSIYLLHFWFCWYVLAQIIYQSTLKVMGKTPAMMSYDGKKKV